MRVWGRVCFIWDTANQQPIGIDIDCCERPAQHRCSTQRPADQAHNHTTTAFTAQTRPESNRLYCCLRCAFWQKHSSHRQIKTRRADPSIRSHRKVKSRSSAVRTTVILIYHHKAHESSETVAPQQLYIHTIPSHTTSDRRASSSSYVAVRSEPLNEYVLFNHIALAVFYAIATSCVCVCIWRICRAKSLWCAAHIELGSRRE